MLCPLLIILVFHFTLPPSTTAVVRVKQETSSRKMLSGAMSFRDLVTQSSMFVDKTLLIKEFLELPTRVVLVTCPRRWGKSLNMDMIREFLQITPEEIAHQTIPDETSGRIRLQQLPGVSGSAESSESHRAVKLTDLKNRLHDSENRISRNFTHQLMAGQIVPLHQHFPKSNENFFFDQRTLELKRQTLTGDRVNSLFDWIFLRKNLEQAAQQSFLVKPWKFDFNRQNSRVHSGTNRLFNRLNSSVGINDPVDWMLQNKTGPLRWLAHRNVSPRSQKNGLSKLTALGDEINNLFNQKSQIKNKTGPQKRLDVSAYRLFSHGETVTGNYSGLAIADHPDIISQYLGQHPVLSVSLLIPFANSFDKLFDNLQQKLAQVYTAYAYAFETRAENAWADSWRTGHAESPWDEAIEQDPWRQAQEQNSWQDTHAQNDRASANHCREMLRKLRAQNATEAELASSLRLLSRLLHQRYAARVFVLIDDYDTPVNSAFARFTGDSREYGRTIAFLSRFFHETFANNPHVEKGLVTGVNAIAVHELFAEVDFEHHNMLRSQVSRHYGFSENDVTQLFHEAKVPLALAATAKRFYAGYALGSRQGLCNPWDISQFLKLPKLRRWWVETGGAGFFDRVFRFEALEVPLLTLISRSGIETPLRPALTAAEYAVLKDMLAGRTPFDTYGAQFFLSFVFAAGYLTRDDDVIRLGTREEETSQVWVKLPNEEIASELTDVLLRYYDSFISLNHRGNVRRGIYAEFQRMFKEGSTASFKEALEAFLKQHPRFSNNSTVRAALNHVLLSIGAAEGDFFLKTGIQGEAKQPRRPALAVADPDLGVGVILELEFGRTGDVVLSQAERYSGYLSDKRVKNIRFVGIGVFPNKTVTIKHSWRART